MKNIDIITNECAVLGIKEAVDTFQGWKRKGFKVIKGQKATFDTQIWMPSKKKKEDVEAEKSKNGETKKYQKFYMTKAFFFTEKQVEKIENQVH